MSQRKREKLKQMKEIADQNGKQKSLRAKISKLNITTVTKKKWILKLHRRMNKNLIKVNSLNCF
jgi:hypothetical protein